jgi:putative transposase
VAGLLGMNKNTVQRIFQLKGWQVRKWGGRDGWLSLALVIDCYSRQLLG